MMATHDADSSGELTSGPSYLDCSDINLASVDCVPFVLILSLPYFRFSETSIYACYATASPYSSATTSTSKTILLRIHNALLHLDGRYGSVGFRLRHADHPFGSPSFEAR